MTYYKRNLPHWHPEGRILFITWRLYGSLPVSVLRSLRAHRNDTGRQFRAADSELDKALSGPVWLKDPRVAWCVVKTLRRGEELGHYALYSFVVMANHVHVLLAPKVAVSRITNGIKGVTSRQANKLLGRTGKRFWQDESFDHWVRNEIEFERIRAYVERNPISAGLVTKPGDWPWSSAWQRVGKI